MSWVVAARRCRCLGCGACAVSSTSCDVKATGFSLKVRRLNIESIHNLSLEIQHVRQRSQRIKQTWRFISVQVLNRRCSKNSNSTGKLINLKYWSQVIMRQAKFNSLSRLENFCFEADSKHFWSYLLSVPPERSLFLFFFE